jgi:hypothetical protein
LQAIKEPIPQPCKLIVFPRRMGTPAPLPPEQPGQLLSAPVQSGWWQRHGNTAQWAAAIISIVALVGLFANIGLTLWFHYTAGELKASDEHIKSLIDAKLNPAVQAINSNIDQKLAPINQQLETLTQQVGQLQGRFQQLDTGQKKISARLDQQASLAKLMDPNRVLRTIREEIQTARRNGKLLPASDLADYKNAVHAVPTSAYEYWTTVAAIINYQSFLEQLRGNAPNPYAVSEPCATLTNDGHMISQGNVTIGATFSNCIVDLDTETLRNVVFRNSVVRYSGGSTNLSNVTFVNCRFILNIGTKPEKPELLLSLLDSPSAESIKIQ